MLSALGHQSWAIARKELRAYFGSPMALIFIGVFLAAVLFAVFWVEKFFARGIADVRPLFRWLPVLLIFLISALTMRQWSEEQRSGTLEILLTLPARRLHLVTGKFLAVMLLVATALALTFFLPISVSRLGDLDWGPVAGGYLAALLLAAAYAAIGLFISSRTDNQIVALILTALVCGAFYLVGTETLTGLTGGLPAEILRALGAGSRFESIERGVIDLRDLAYYGSLTALFLFLNVVSLDMKRWSHGRHTAAYRRNVILSAILLGANLLALNTWLFPLHGLRADLTARHEYSLSAATRNLVRSLPEPLLIRGYFSEKTHPLLAPLVPPIRDMLREYQIASGGQIRVELVDPQKNAELEAEANQIYGIRPTPFRVQGRYEASVINSYFDILIHYGDQHVTLGFQDLIEIEQSGNEVNVRLRNLEYDLTRSIKKVVYGFQSLDALFARLEQPAKLTAYITPQTLPAELQNIPARIQKIAQDMQAAAGGKFTFVTIDPDASGSSVSRQDLYTNYGIQPIAASLFSNRTYYLHLVLTVGEATEVIVPSGDLSESSIRTQIESALKRAAPGFLKTVGLWTPPAEPYQNPLTGQMQQPISSWQMIRDQLATNYTVKSVDLKSAAALADVDVLVLIAPQNLSDVERFNVDQYLMRGGAVIVAAGNVRLAPQQFGGITLNKLSGGLNEMLTSYGVTISDTLVLDTRNEPFPVQVQRNLGMFSVTEIQQISYPFFIDIRSDGMASGSPIVSSLSAVTLQWASPVLVDESKNEGRQVTTLLRSSPHSWLRTSLDTQPDLQTYPETGFPIEGEQKSWPLAVSLRGVFQSHFAGRAAPVQSDSAVTETTSIGVIETSPPSARLIVIGSCEFLDDIVLRLSQNLSQDRYLFNLQFMQNAVDWAVEDEDLLSIRSRGTYARLLAPLSERQQSLWEWLNYAVALAALIILGVIWNLRQRGEKPLAVPVTVPDEPVTVPREEE